MLLLSLLSCILDPSPTLFARFEVAPTTPAPNQQAGSVTILGENTWLRVDGSTIVVTTGESEVQHSNVSVANPSSLRATSPTSAVALTTTGVAYTGDTGATFTEVILPPLTSGGTPMGVIALAKERVLIGPSNPTPGEFWFSEDGGATFEEVQFPAGDDGIIEVRSGGTHVLVETANTEGTHLHTWNPKTGSVKRVHTNSDNTRHVLPQHATTTGIMLAAGPHPWSVDGLAPFVFTRDLDRLERPWEWGAVHAGGFSSTSTLVGLSHDDRVIIGGPDLRASAMALGDPRARPDLFAGPRCDERYRLRPPRVDEPSVQAVSVTNNTPATLIPVWIQTRGTWSQRWDLPIAPGETVEHQGPYSRDNAWYLMLEGLEDGRCYGVFEIDNTGPSAVTAESRG